MTKKQCKNLDFVEVKIFDNVHGFVRITEGEKEILNSIYFQRLRDLKQLGLAYYVFPGAVHTRFSHSIGVLAVMDKILTKLQEVCSEYITIKDVRILRMAALLHDVGHYPLSHTIEAVYMDIQPEFITDRFMADDEEGDNQGLSVDGINANLIKAVTNMNGHHEVFGDYVIRNTDYDGGITRILRTNGFIQDEIDEIGKIIKGKSGINWHNQVMHSDLDADRLDYLLRDSANTGVKFGSFDFEYLINNCRLVKKDDEIVFCVKSRAIFTIEHFLMTRYYWYSKIIYERTIAIFDKMAQMIYAWLVKHEKAYNYLEVLQSVSDPLKFITFNDMYFWERINWIINSGEAEELEEYGFYRELAILLLQRKPLRRIKTEIARVSVGINTNCDECSERELCGVCLAAAGTECENEFDTFVSETRKILESNDINVDWLIPVPNKTRVSRLKCQLDEESAVRDPIQVIGDGDALLSMNEQSYSIINNLSKEELVIRRAYVKEEYTELVVKD